MVSFGIREKAVFLAFIAAGFVLYNVNHTKYGAHMKHSGNINSSSSSTYAGFVTSDRNKKTDDNEEAESIDTTTETSATSPTDINSSTGRAFEGLKIRSFDKVFKSTSKKYTSTVMKEDLPFYNHEFSNKCSKWGVVTTIFEPTIAIKRMASLPSWCLVVVADTKTPVDYMQKLKAIPIEVYNGSIAYSDDEFENVFFFSVEEQKKWEQLDCALGNFVKIMPWRHFGRKNLGYLYAIMHGANFIFDFDDDNYIKLDTFGKPLNILPSEDVLENVTIVSQGPSAFNHHTIMKPSINSTTWARGFPLEYIKDATTQGKVAFHKDLPFKSKIDHVGVIQFLADGNPDVDAFHRLSMPLPMTFQFDNHAHPVLVPKHSYSPYNAQAAIHTKNALWATLLPSTVPGRVSDIWRSYFAQCIFADAGLRLVFAPPKISQIRNEHNILGDLQAESDLYFKSGKLIQFLAEWDAEESSVPGRMEQLWIDLYERGYVEIDDVAAVQMWLATLRQIGYKFPPSKRRFRNVAVMGQFNQADTPSLFDNVIFWAQKYREYFVTAIAAGPFSEKQVNVLKQNNIQTIVAETPNFRVDGKYQPVENLMNTLLHFKQSTKIEAVLYAHDDTLLNITELSHGLFPFPTDRIIGNSKGMFIDDTSYVDIRKADDREKANINAYRLFPNGTFTDFNKTVFGSSHDVLIDGVPNFYFRWNVLDDCSRAQIPMVKDPISARYREYDGSILFPSYTQADFLFVPIKYSEEFAQAARIHLKYQVPLECSLAKIVDMIRQQTGAEVRQVNLCTTWGGQRGQPTMLQACRKKKRKKPKIGDITVVHPMRLSQRFGLYSEQMDSIQF